MLVAAGLAACSDQPKAPDISTISLRLQEKRFDRDFFSMDTTAPEKSLAALQQKYPDLLNIYLQHIVGITDNVGIGEFFRTYKPIYDSAQLIYKDFGKQREQLEHAFRYVKYYFPVYVPPAYVIPVIGPMNAKEDMARMSNGDYTPNFIGKDFVGVSLQYYLGADFSLYNNQYFINNVAPLYRSRRFAKEYIVGDVMKLVTDDVFPDNSASLTLIEQMVERGKQWWLIEKFLPTTPDSVRTGYTKHELDWCAANEGLIWSYIVRNEKLDAIDPATIQVYIGEAPFTQGLSPQDSPGNLGPWIGRQIIRAYAEKNTSMTPSELIKIPATKIIEEAKYKPK